MKSKMTIHGISTTTEKNQFQYEEYSPVQTRFGNRVMWDYRDKEGILHSGITKTVEEAKEKASKFGYKE